MKTAPECIPCLVRQASEALALCEKDPWKRMDALRVIERDLALMDWGNCAPALAQKIHRIIRRETKHPDPYAPVKERMNRLALAGLARWREFISGSPNPREAALRLAAAGNLLDSAAKSGASPDETLREIAGSLNAPFAGDPDEFFRLAERAARILYLADNAGEIVFDRLLIEALPAEKITLAVRGAPVINDALLEDATVAGLGNLVKIVSNGNDAPGTLLDECSAEFRAHFYAADLIVSKGQGNYESLADIPAPIFFLFTVKCERVGSHIGHPPGTLVAQKSPAWTPLPPTSIGRGNKPDPEPGRPDL